MKIGTNTYKSTIANHLINNNAKSLKRKDGPLVTTIFYSQNDKLLGSQTIGKFTENKALQNSDTNQNIYINREFYNKLPQKLYKQFIIIEQKLKKFSTIKKIFLLPTYTKTTKVTIFQTSNTMRKEIIENELVPYYSPWDKPKYTRKTSEEILPYKENSLNQFGMF